MTDKKRGRKKVKESERVTKCRYQGQALDFLRKYLFEEKLGNLFQRGELKIKLDEQKLELGYIPPKNKCALSLDLDLKFEVRREWDEAFEMVQDFLMDCFYFHEWDGRPLRLTELGVIMGVTKQAVHREVKNILKKINSDEKCLNTIVKKLAE